MSLGRIASIILIALAAAVPSYALAIGERLSFAQSPDGSILAIVSGALPGCTLGFSTSAVAIAGSSITITTGTLPLLCPAPPPGTPLGAYSLSVNLGHLADGAYSVNWLFNASPAVLQPASGAFAVSSGALIDPLAVPTLSPLGLAILAIFVVAGAQRQRRNAV
jgi:hypothetical protein